MLHAWLRLVASSNNTKPVPRASQAAIPVLRLHFPRNSEPSEGSVRNLGKITIQLIIMDNCCPFEEKLSIY